LFLRFRTCGANGVFEKCGFDPFGASVAELRLTPDSKAVLSLAREDAGMNTNTTRTWLFGSAVAAAMLFGGVIGATVLAKSTLAPANASTFSAPLAVTTVAPKSNEDATHEATESVAREAAENNGTARPAGGGTPNETAAHEAGESTAQEAAEDARVKAATPAN
jgi:hypothetical protein